MTTVHQLDQAMGAVVGEAIRGAKLTQREVSDETGIPLVTLNRKLRGTQSFRVFELAAVARLLGTTLTNFSLLAEQRAVSTAAA
ncbi:helix-turn-helix domain-containing protein [Tessaracoccus massiliensis]|uniref:helix-turn-helix domain-containing protein n=1 Tax=Tessaracoccus massiliensis TaxID=1522311 RepID=UPI0015D58D6B|nr:helix-turn-helix transcriptional regulator [Tessaracoccus massiliensis]